MNYFVRGLRLNPISSLIKTRHTTDHIRPELGLGSQLSYSEYSIGVEHIRWRLCIRLHFAGAYVEGMSEEFCYSHHLRSLHRSRLWCPCVEHRSYRYRYESASFVPSLHSTLLIFQCFFATPSKGGCFSCCALQSPIRRAAAATQRIQFFFPVVIPAYKYTCLACQ
jgi:hypothetical protein